VRIYRKWVSTSSVVVVFGRDDSAEEGNCRCLAWHVMEGVTHDSGAGINRAAQRVDGNDMRCLLVPGSVLLPVARRDFLPRVVEVD
jgi:hypothetical protein